MQEEKDTGLHFEIEEEIGSLLSDPDKYPQLGPYSREKESVIFSSDSGRETALTVTPQAIAFKDGNGTLKLELGNELGIPSAYFFGKIKDETRQRVNQILALYMFGASRVYKEITHAQAVIANLFVGQHGGDDEFKDENLCLLGAATERPQLFHGNVAGRNVIAVSMPNGMGAFTNINVKTYEKKVFDPGMEIASFCRSTPIRRFTSASFFSDEQLKSWTPSLEYNFRLPLGIGENFVQSTIIEPFLKSRQA